MSAMNFECQRSQLLPDFTLGEGKSCLPFQLITELSGCVLYGFVNVKTMMSLGRFQFGLTVRMWNQILEGRKQTLMNFNE